jgi:hypothetical protein
MPEHTRTSRADPDQLGRENNANLWKLRNGWGEVFEISVVFPDKWRAVRIGEPGTVLEAGSAAELRVKMIADHESRPLPRRPLLPDADGD